MSQPRLPRATRRRLKQLKRDVKHEIVDITMTGKQHLKIVLTDGVTTRFYITANSWSDHRGYKNAVAGMNKLFA